MNGEKKQFVMLIACMSNLGIVTYLLIRYIRDEKSCVRELRVKYPWRIENKRLTLCVSNINLNLNKMKKLGKIKLNQFSKDELDRRKLNALKGGCGCTSGSCGCGGASDHSYYNNFGSSNKPYHY